MRDESRLPVAIVGGGLAGLTAAVALRRRGIPVLVFEAGPQLAGLARSHRDADGFTYDFGAHFITNRLAAAIGVGAHCRLVRHYGEAVWVRGRAVAYPFGLATRPRYAASALRARLRPGTERSAADRLRHLYGAALAEEIAAPLLEAWSGAPAQDLAPAVVAKLQHGIGATLWLKGVGRATQRAVAIGYSHTMPEGAQVWHVYPEGGVARLCEALAAEVGDAIRLSCPVEAIVVEDERAVGVQVGGELRPAAAVISTAPANILPRLVRGTERLAPLARLRFRAMTFVNLRLEGRGLLPDTVLWMPERAFPFFRLTETTRSMPWLAPPGHTLITADLGCAPGDPVWTMDDAALGELCVGALAAVVPDARRRYQGCRVLRTPIAYPVFHREYEDVRQRLIDGTGIAGLYTIGRNGEFAHILMEDVYWRTRAAMRRVMQEIGAPATRSPAPPASRIVMSATPA